MTERSALRRAFLASYGLAGADVTPLAGDASFRRYARVAGKDGSFVLMDAPPDREDVRPFVAIARHLQSLGYSAPKVFATDVENGFLLLEDLGEATYTRVLGDGGMEEPLYGLAVDLLIDLHRRPLEMAVPASLPAYTDKRFLEEAMLLTDWYFPAVTGDPPSPEIRQEFAALWPPLLDLARAVPETLVLRDYHVDNLLFLPEREGVGACGLLDFQDAIRGPGTYDVVSLLGDARRDLAPAHVERMKERYLAAFPELDRQAFARAYAILGAQRNCKILGIFTRLFRRDGKALYLAHIPRVWWLLEENLRARELAPLQDWLDANLPAALRQRAGGEALMMAQGMPARAMVLAAGRGERLRPLTDRLPKPLVPIAGRTLLDRALDRLVAAGIEEVVVNLHYLSAQIRAQLAPRCDLRITYSEEAEPLETGGGLRKALAHFQGRPFFAINGDVLWQDAGDTALARLASAWDDAKMDGLLLLQPVAHAVGYEGAGDFEMAADGRLERRQGPVVPFVFTGVQLLHPRLFDAAPEGRFSLNLLYDAALSKGRLFGLAHKGAWYHIGTLDGLTVVEGRFQERHP